MSDLPPGFVLEGQQSVAGDAGLPSGFVLQGAQPERPKFGLGDTWPARLAKSIYSAVTLPGDVAQGNVSMVGEDGHTNPEVINRSADLAGLASPLAPRAALTATAAKAVIPTREALESAANAGYTKARGLGVDIAPQSVSQMGGRIGATLEEKGINDKLAPKTFSILGEIAKPPADSVVTLSNLETIRRALGHAAKDFGNPTEQLAARTAQSHLDDYLAAIPAEDVVRGPASEASTILGEARGNFAAAKRSGQITDAVDAADISAAAANSGQNVGNATRQRLKSILLSDKKISGFSPDEIASMEQVVRGSKLSNSTRVLGNVLGGGGGLGSFISAAGGASALGPAGIATPALGVALKKVSDALVSRQTRKLDELVRSRSPLAGPQPATQEISPAKIAVLRALLTSQPQQ